MAFKDFGVSFNGRRIVHPGAYDYIDASGMLASSPGTMNIPVVVGEAESGEVGVLKWFSDVDSANEYLRGGDLHTALNIMYGESGAGSNTIGVIVTNSCTKANKSIGGLDISSVQAGEGSNRIQVKLTDGTIPGTKRFIATRWDLEMVEDYDDIGAIIKILYMGTGLIATASVTDHVLKMTVDGEEDLVVDLTKFDTVGALTKYLNGVRGYKVVVSNPRVMSLPVSVIENVEEINIKKGDYLLSVKGHLEVELAKLSKLVNVKVTGELTNFEETYLEGAQRGSSPSSWSKYFSLLRREFTDLLVVLTDDLSVQMEAHAHIKQMESRGQKQMLFTGGSIGESVNEITERAAMFSSSRVVLGYPGIKYKLPGDEVVTDIPSYFTGALIAAKVCGISPSDPVTFKYVSIQGMETELVVGDPEIDELITSGVCTLEIVPPNKGIRIVQGVTTYTGDNNILEREISVRRGADDLSTRVTRTLEDTYVGKKGLRATILAIKNTTIQELDSAMSRGDIVGYGDVRVTFQNTVATVEFEVCPVEPINYILITSHFVPGAMTTATGE